MRTEPIRRVLYPPGVRATVTIPVGGTHGRVTFSKRADDGTLVRWVAMVRVRKLGRFLKRK